MAQLSQVFNLKTLQSQEYKSQWTGNRSVMELAYTILAGSAVCMRLKIQKSAYRLLRSADHNGPNTLVLVCKSDQVSTNEIKAPFSIINNFGNKVTLDRLNLGIMSINQSLLPQVPEAQDLFIFVHTSSIFMDAIKQIIAAAPFVVSNKRQQIQINLNWFKDKQFLKDFRSDALLQLRRLIAENDSNKYTNYLKLNVKAICDNQVQQKHNSCLFVPNKTKLTFQKAMHYDLNEITKIIHLSKLQQQIFSMPIYEKLRKSFMNLIEFKPEKKIILFKMMQGTGLSSFMHKLSQDLEYSFVKVDCKYFVSDKQLIDKIKYSDSFNSTVVYIKNIDWLLQVGSDKNDDQQKMKRIIRSLEEAFLNLGQHSLSSHVLIIEFKANTIKLDMTKNASLVNFELSKQQKIQILHQVITYHLNEDKIELQNQQQVINLAANSLGWVVFSRVLTMIKGRQKQQSKIKTSVVLNEIGKLTNVQKVENIKSISWDDVGGLQTAKEQIIQTILLPTKHPEIFDEWIKPRTGLLFFGPPGTGKTLLGKCIANECKMGFISVKGPQLLNMYIGQSEKNVRDVFERAAASRPCIVFMDELDALIPKRGQSSDSNQVMDRIVSELLAQMDKAPSRGIFIIGATNRPDLLDPSILRPGRFDKQIYLGITKEKQARIQILKAQTRNIKLKQGFNYERVIDSVPQNFTGADFYGLTSRSVMKAAERFIQQYEKQGKLPSEEVEIGEEDFIETAKDIKPSVSLKELQHYEKLKQQYK